MNSQSPRFRHVGFAGLAGSMSLTFALMFTGGACGGGGGSSGTAGHAGGATGTAGALGTAGAGTGGATGTAGAAANTPVGQCDQFVSAFCNRLIECEPSDGGPDLATCNELFQIAYRCAGATASTAFPTCISDVAGTSCLSLFDATSGAFIEPNSCMAPLDNIPLTVAQNNCLDLVDVLCDPADICTGGTLAQTTDVASCEDDAISQLGCEFVTGESSTFNMCLNDLCSTAADAGAAPADAGDGGELPIPTTCNNVLTFPPM
jgi:hypothetical protein